MLKKIKFNFYLINSFIIVIGFILLSLILTYFSLSKILIISKQLYKYPFSVTQSLAFAEQHITAIQHTLLQAVATGSHNQREINSYQKEINKFETEAFKDLKKAEELLLCKQELFENINKSLANWKTIRDVLLKANTVIESKDLNLLLGKRNEISNNMSKILEFADKKAYEFHEISEGEIFFYKNLLMIFLIIILCLSSVIAYFMILMAKKIKAINDEIIKQKEWLEVTLAGIGDGVIAVDMNCKIQFINPVTERLTGYTKEESLGKEMLEVFNIVNEETKEKAKNPVERVIAEGTVVGMANHTELISKDGKAYPIADSAAPIKNSAGKMLGVVMVFRDLTELRLNEIRFQSIFELSPFGIALIYLSSNNIYIDEVNQSFANICGRSLEELKNSNWMKILHPEDLPQLLNQIEMLNTGEISTFQMNKRYLLPDGSIAWTNTTVSHFKDQNPCKKRFLCMIEEISQRKSAEDALRKSEEKLRAVLNATPFPIAIVDLQDDKINFWSRSALSIFGHTAPTAAEWYQLAYPDPDYRNEVIARWKPMLEMARESGKAINTGEYRVSCHDGAFRICELYAAFISDNLIVTFNDITERKRSEELLRETEEQLRLTLEQSHIGAWSFDIKKYTAIRSIEHAHIFGYEDILSNWSFSLFLEHVILKDRAMVEEEFQQAIKSKSKFSFECRICRYKDTEERWIWVSGYPQLNSSGEVYQLSGIVMDINERKQIEEQLRNSETRLRMAITNSPFPLMIHAEDGKVVMISDVWLEITGYTWGEISTISDWIERAYGSSNKLMIQKDVRRLYDLDLYKKVKEGEYQITTKSGEKRIWDFMSASIGKLADGRRVILSMAMDVTEKKLIQEQKIESLGLLAGGIAHDFNNLLSGIFGYMELAKNLCERGEFTDIASYLGMAGEMFDRAKALSQQLLTFSKGGSPILKQQSILPLIKNSIQFALAGSDIIANVDIAEDLWWVNIDENQIHQVIDNLIINAKQSMPMGGQIKISAKNIPATSHLIPVGLSPASYICISIEDQGHGISREHLPRIFEPFFSNKLGGSGLGLSIVYSIIKKHQGIVEVKSQLGKGTTFYLYLPAISSSETMIDVLQAEKEKKKEKEKEFFYPYTVLFIDDEEGLCKLAENYFKEFEANFTSALNGEEGAKLFRKAYDDGTPFQIVICDLTIPGKKGGVEIIKELRSIASNFVAIASSGYSNNSVMAQPQKYDFNYSINKPYHKSTLIEVLKNTVRAIFKQPNNSF
ncbi:MAG: PAS domain S-box protein [Oligoflexia bacterium]|nr:PAS domain S-box protein [Oligoflexia bacterium]